MANSSSQATVAARFKQPSSQSATPKADGSPAPSNDLSTAAISTKNNSNIVYNYYPIDVAIAQSIQSASGNSDDRLKRYFTNIIVVGGGVAKISNFDRVLEDRLLSTMIARSSGIEDVDVLPAPRELDPEILVWKGASVLCKLEIAKDMWIGEPEWMESGLRLIRDRSLLLF
jgi:actin-related protein 8